MWSIGLNPIVVGRQILLLVAAAFLLGVAWPALGQGLDLQDRPISEIRVRGLKDVKEELVRNQIRLAPGDPYSAEVVREDIRRIVYLGRFSQVFPEVQPTDDGGVILTYVVNEQPALADVQVVGNKSLSDQELLGMVLLRAGDPVDPYAIDRGKKAIEQAYQDRGYFVVSVSVDEQLLADSNVLLYRLREGPRPRIERIVFEGNENFDGDQLDAQIKSNEQFLIFKKGELSREQLDEDAGRLRDFYRDRGYLNANVGRQIELSPNQKNATVRFVIDEGERFTVGKIMVKGNVVLPTEQILTAMALKVGGVCADDARRKSQQDVTDMYGRLGFLDIFVRVEFKQRLDQPKPVADVEVTIQEGFASRVGTVTIGGNEITKTKVIQRQTRGIDPGERFDRSGIEVTETRLSESALFSKADLTVLGEPGDPVRDVFIEVVEQQTGNLAFGVGASSDAGVVGAIDLTQRNFDIADTPETLGEFITGKAFRGAGQYFAISLQPGNETSRYSVSFREPYLLESDLFLDSTLFIFQRQREKYDEGRLGGAVGIGQRFGDVYSATVRARAEQIDISDLDDDAPVDVFAVEGDSLLTSLGLSITRSDVDSRIFPTRGTRTTVGITQAGALGGDYDFTSLDAEFRAYWTVDEDFFGYKTVLSMRMETSYIVDGDAPTFEQYYAGGHRSFRGFRYRGVGPRGIRNDNGKVGDDPVGGDWLFLLSFEYNFPIYEDTFRWVVFTDTGTVQDDFGFDQYRVSVGTGIRLKLPFLGQAPFALDVAVPILKEEDDEVRYISFDFAVPF
jgi:outer membrane protein insertion porin family